MAHLPFTRPTDFMRERDFGRKIEASFDFLRAHIRPLGQALLYIVLPLFLIQGIASGLLQSRMGGMFNIWRNSFKLGANKEAATQQMVTDFLSSPEYWLSILAGIFAFTLLLLTVYGYLVLRLEKEDPNEPVTVREVWAVVRRRFLSTLLSFFGLAVLFVVAVFAVGMVVAVLGAFLGGFRFLVVVMIAALYVAMAYVSVALSLFFIVQMRERTGFFATIGRCFSLIWGKWWSTFGLVMVMGLLLMVLVIVVMMLTSLITLPFASPAGQEPTAMGQVTSVVATCLNSVAIMGLYPLVFLALAFQYFNLVERKEGHGLYEMLHSIGAEPETAATPLAFQADDEGEY